ncbi:MAG TPA: D-alanyl-lipoteichoic acid biosynthesis protein DltB [Chloroflexia bacterium]|nr:D-alanyl-lipoteichoic acid biosynthesis protein DltB [Chloroflexia bacterium]
MIPYGNFLYFGLLAYPVLPALLLGWLGRLSRRWILLAILAVLLVQYGSSLRVWHHTDLPAIAIVGGYALFEWAITRGFLQVRRRGRHRAPFWAALGLGLLPLVLAKGLPLAVPGTLLGFLGISYVTFRSLDVLFGIQDGLITELPAGQYLAYLFFFPTISAGPIDRYRRFAGDWQRVRNRAAFLADLNGAVQRIFTGLLYKFILAYLVQRYWLEPAAGQPGLLGTLSYMYAYSFYLFFDFAGYSAFAIGVSYLFGIHTPENFDRPFLARNIRDFWNRWHISLSTWFRDHVYMRFLLAATKGRWFRNRHLGSYLGFFLSFGLMGLWHGTEAQYLLYGLYHASLLVGFDLLSRWNKERRIWGDGPGWHVAAVLITFHVVCFGFLIFSGHLGQAPPPAAPATAEGVQETTSCDTIAGWAWDRRQPATPVSVAIYDGSLLLATVRADQFRADLRAAGKGDGAHVFLYTPPSSLSDGQPHPIHVRFAGTATDLQNAPQTLTCNALVTTMAGLDGAQDPPTCAAVSGWAWDIHQPDAPVPVAVYDGATLLGTLLADQPRPGLREAGIGNGNHGFRYLLPARLHDGQPHALRVRMAGSAVDLRNTLQPVTCPAP